MFLLECPETFVWSQYRDFRVSSSCVRTWLTGVQSSGKNAKSHVIYPAGSSLFINLFLGKGRSSHMESLEFEGSMRETGISYWTFLLLAKLLKKKKFNPYYFLKKVTEGINWCTTLTSYQITKLKCMQNSVCLLISWLFLLSSWIASFKYVFIWIGLLIFLNIPCSDIHKSSLPLQESTDFSIYIRKKHNLSHWVV